MVYHCFLVAREGGVDQSTLGFGALCGNGREAACGLAFGMPNSRMLLGSRITESGVYNLKSRLKIAQRWKAKIYQSFMPPTSTQNPRYWVNACAGKDAEVFRCMGEQMRCLEAV